MLPFSQILKSYSCCLSFRNRVGASVLCYFAKVGPCKLTWSSGHLFDHLDVGCGCLRTQLELGVELLQSASRKSLTWLPTACQPSTQDSGSSKDDNNTDTREKPLFVAKNEIDKRSHLPLTCTSHRGRYGSNVQSCYDGSCQHNAADELRA